ncbi:MAG: hypothetical protein FWG67_10365 [Defluviitaleaceae bacterium]|nr:hypothetical protein [Defluviitaleaceae bacterium]
MKKVNKWMIALALSVVLMTAGAPSVSAAPSLNLVIDIPTVVIDIPDIVVEIPEIVCEEYEVVRRRFGLGILQRILSFLNLLNQVSIAC